MNYELAKQLKDAGFPQESDGLTSVYYQEDKERIRLRHIENDTEVKIPTLSELIEACVGKVFMLLINRNLEGRWASAVDGKGASGDTPEEAVARLWLALNKK